MTARLKSNLKMLAFLVIFILVASIWTKPFSPKWWGGTIMVLFIFLILPNAIDLYRAFAISKQTRNLQLEYINNRSEFRDFIYDKQPSWLFANIPSSEISIQLDQYLYINYEGSQNLPVAVRGLWEDWNSYKEGLLSPNRPSDNENMC